MQWLDWIGHELALHKDALIAFGALASPLAVLIGVLASVRIANKNLRGALISNQRREWMGHVRDEVAAILGALGPLRMDHQSPLQATRMIELMSELLVRQAKLTLLMDPKNQKQFELVSAARIAVEHAHEARNAKNANYVDPLPSDIQKLVDTAHEVLATAWKEAKTLREKPAS